MKNREIWVDWLRVVACFMVMVVHSTEPFYLGGEGTIIRSAEDAFWAPFVDSLVRACVPLFIIASSYLQFPVHYPTGEFLRRRAVRVLVPLLLWSVVYAIVWGEPVENFTNLLQNFNYAAGHLWFVYMIFGLYLVMPLLSPWAEKVGRKEISIYLAIWLFTTIIPYLRIWLGGTPPVIYGPSGIPNPARYPLWGEASWNANGTFYYVSGLAGYLLLGLYFRKFAGEWSLRKTLSTGLGCLAAGFAICFGGFRYLMFKDIDSFPFEGPVSYAAIWETPWMFDSLGVVLMAIGTIILMRRIKADGWFYQRLVLPVSQASYGMYLMHMLYLASFSALYMGCLHSTPLIILCTALSSYASSAVTSIIIRKIPKIGRHIV